MAEFQGPCPLRYRCNDFRPSFNDCIPGSFKYGIKHIVVEAGLEYLEEIRMTLISAESKTQCSEPSAALAQRKVVPPPRPPPPSTYSPQPRAHGSAWQQEGATRVDDDDGDDDDNDAAAGDDDSALLFSE